MSVFQTKGEWKKLRNRIIPWSTGDNYASTQVTLSSNMSKMDRDGWQVHSDANVDANERNQKTIIPPITMFTGSPKGKVLGNEKIRFESWNLRFTRRMEEQRQFCGPVSCQVRAGGQVMQ
ncbi:hypothetical protein PABG_12638 [Paracoccidioides brasiliensis Pb03]|nr:hypothetical protein PABG_12638 [Paracoccidioides brasiliensis Pb03]